MSENDGTGLTEDEKIFREAKKRWKRAEEWESDTRKRFIADIKFDAGDSENLWQWDDPVSQKRRTSEKRPALTINKTRQHNLQIINDGKQNRPGVKITPTGGDATRESAQVYEGTVRRIEYVSNAVSAYNTAYSFCVRGGFGYWRVMADYVGDDSFDQDLFIKRIRDPLSVRLDPDIEEEDGTDARFGFIYKDTPKEEVKDEYDLDFSDINSADLPGMEGFVTESHVRVAEYYRRKTIWDKLLLMTEPPTFADGTVNPNAGDQRQILQSEIAPSIRAAVLEDPETRSRKVKKYRVEWFKIVGNKIVARRQDENALPISMIPIVRVVAEEIIVDNKLDRKSHTRSMKDPQRMYNYQSSTMVETTALQTKSEWTMGARAYEGYEKYWNSANTKNWPVLVWNDKAEDPTNPVQPPQRVHPPEASMAAVKSMEIAQHELRMASGQYADQLGDQSHERSGIAIDRRQRQGDNATYHFIDALGLAIRKTGKILIEWIPHIYDTERIVKILAEDGTEEEIAINPEQKKALEVEKKRDEQNQEAVKRIFNPKVGTYDVQADVGPGYATRRQQAFDAVSNIAANNMDLMRVVGDILFKNADFPGADELQERMRRMVPKDILGEGPPPEMAELQMQLDQMKSVLEEMIKELAVKDIELKEARGNLSIDAYKAETDRATNAFKAVTDRMKVIGLPPEDMQDILLRLVAEAMQNALPDADEAAYAKQMQFPSQSDQIPQTVNAGFGQ